MHIRRPLSDLNIDASTLTTNPKAANEFKLLYSKELRDKSDLLKNVYNLIDRLAQLTHNTKEVIEQHYGKEKNVTDLAKILGIRRDKITQIHDEFELSFVKLKFITCNNPQKIYEFIHGAVNDHNLKILGVNIDYKPVNTYLCKDRKRFTAELCEFIQNWRHVTSNKMPNPTLEDLNILAEACHFSGKRKHENELQTPLVLPPIKSLCQHTQQTLALSHSVTFAVASARTPELPEKREQAWPFIMMHPAAHK